MFVRNNGKPFWCGNTVMAYRTKNRLFNETLAKAEAFLRTTGYAGYIDINCIVNESGAYGLEFTSRFGYPTVLIQDELHTGGWGLFLYKLANGTAERVPANTEKWCVGVAYTTLPWPLQNKSMMFKNRPVFFPNDLSHIHFSDIWRDADGTYKQAGECGFLAVATGSDPDLRRAKEKAYDIIKKIHAPGGFYRSDIGDKLIENLPTLKQWGWIK